MLLDKATTIGQSPEPEALLAEWERAAEAATALEDDESLVTVYPEEENPPGFDLLAHWLLTQCRLMDTGEPGGMLLQVCVPEGVYQTCDLRALAVAAGCRLHLAEWMLPKTSGSDIELMVLPRSRQQAATLLRAAGQPSGRRIWLWLTEEIQPLLESGYLPQTCFDLTTPAWRWALVRYVWQQYCLRLWQREVWLAEPVLAELCSLPLPSLRPALYLLLAQGLAEGDLEALVSLANLGPMNFLQDAERLPQATAAVQDWVIETLQTRLASQSLYFASHLGDHELVVLCEQAQINFEIVCKHTLDGIFLESRCETSLPAEWLGVLVGLANRWNGRGGPAVVIEQDEDGGLQILLRQRLDFPPEASLAWAKTYLLRSLDHICGFWVVEIGLLQRGQSCRH